MRNKIIHAAHFAMNAHAGQVRKYTGVPYFLHCARVAGAVASQFWATEDAVAAAYLHDVLEDTDRDEQLLRQSFGDTVAGYVVALTNTSKQHPGLSRAERKRLDREHYIGVDPIVKRIKFLDRIDNIRDLLSCDDPKFAEMYLGESELLAECLMEEGSYRFVSDELLGDMRQASDNLRNRLCSAAALNREAKGEHPAVTLLRELEWSGVLVIEGSEWACCPDCAGLPSHPVNMHPANWNRCHVGHTSDCRLAALIPPPHADVVEGKSNE